MHTVGSNRECGQPEPQNLGAGLAGVGAQGIERGQVVVIETHGDLVLLLPDLALGG
jgi:hypothetical protein